MAQTLTVKVQETIMVIVEAENEDEAMRIVADFTDSQNEKEN